METITGQKEVAPVRNIRKGISKKEFLQNAKKRGAVVYKNNIHKAKSLSEVTGNVVAKKEYDPEELVCR